MKSISKELFIYFLECINGILKCEARGLSREIERGELLFNPKGSVSAPWQMITCTLGMVGADQAGVCLAATNISWALIKVNDTKHNGCVILPQQGDSQFSLEWTWYPDTCTLIVTTGQGFFEAMQPETDTLKGMLEGSELI